MRRGTTTSIAGGTVAAALVGALALAGPAQAKGIDSVTLDGPGLAGPVVLSTSGNGTTLVDHRDRSVSLIDELDPWVVMGGTPVDLLPEAPTRDLGPAYTATWRMFGVTTPVEQDVYPFAAGGPLVHIPAEPIWDYNTRDTWYRVPDTTLATLADVGVIAATESRSGRSYAVMDRTTTPSSPSSGDPAWPEAIAGAVAAAVLAGVAGATVVRRRRARRRQRVAPVPL
jgi:hypothetical protein